RHAGGDLRRHRRRGAHPLQLDGTRGVASRVATCGDSDRLPGGLRVRGLRPLLHGPRADHRHMNLPVFLVVIPMGLLSRTSVPTPHPAVGGASRATPPPPRPQTYGALLRGGPAAPHIAPLALLSPLMVAALAPLALRLLRRRVLGDCRPALTGMPLRAVDIPP